MSKSVQFLKNVETQETVRGIKALFLFIKHILHVYVHKMERYVFINLVNVSVRLCIRITIFNDHLARITSCSAPIHINAVLLHAILLNRRNHISSPGEITLKL